MYLRRCRRTKAAREHVYWQLVESHRTERGPRQRVVAYLGDLAPAAREGVLAAAEGRTGIWQRLLFDEDLEPEWAEIDTRRVRVERPREFGAWWIGLHLIEQLGLTTFLEETLPQGAEEVPWSLIAMVLVLCRLCHPSSELRIAEGLYERSALPELLGIPAAKVNDDRLYRALDALLPHKKALETHLRERLGQLFQLEYDLLLYDITSTYFEGESQDNELAARGYSRDHRPDRKQVCIALVVSRCGMPLGYEVFAGNSADAKTVETIVEAVEKQHGKADRIWVMDRGMVSEANLAFLRQGERRYIIGTPKSQLRQFERELLQEPWTQLREGLQVKLVPSPGGDETFILCRSAERRAKEQAMHTRFEQRIEAGLERLAASCHKAKRNPRLVERRIGRLLAGNSRAAGLFRVEARERPEGGCDLAWEKVAAWREWAARSEGCYMLRSNITGWDAADLWRAYITLTDAEAAFRIQKDDLRVRPIWHQKAERVKAHILVCFLAYVLWKTLAQRVRAAGMGDEPRRILDELAPLRMVDVVMRTRGGIEIRRRCVTQPTKEQAALIDRLALRVPRQVKIAEEPSDVV
jgi:transposase